MGKRPRLSSKQKGNIIQDDGSGFTQNLCSKNARNVFAKEAKLLFDVWFDKHYYLRAYYGDDNGKREGIDFDRVKGLVIAASEHLIFFVIKRRDFSFANHEVVSRPERIVLTRKNEGLPDLNIIAEYHFKQINNYEVTIITAMQHDQFKINEGQFQLVIETDGSAKLLRKERGVKKQIGKN